MAAALGHGVEWAQAESEEDDSFARARRLPPF
jgi:hypothetical protein